MAHNTARRRDPASGKALQMADKGIAITFVLALEDDHKHPGCITQLRGDGGGRTRLGIAERFHPALAAEGFYAGDAIEGSTNPQRWDPTTISKDEGMKIALATYGAEYADPLLLDELADQGVANRLLSFCVNEGMHQGVTILQRCLPGIASDGCIGPKTIAAANALDPADLIGRLRDAQVDFYARVASTNPCLAEYAKGMQARANA